MKKLIYIGGICFIIVLSFFYSGSLKAENTINSRLDSISKIPLLRGPLFDRGIQNHSFISRKSIIGGITFSYFSFDSNDSKYLYGLLNGVNYSAGMLGVSPYIGYTFSENKVVGMKVNYSRVNVDLGNIDIDTKDVSLSLGDINFKQNLYGVSLFYRSYVGLDENHRFGLFSEISATATNGDSNFTRGKDKDLKSYTTNILYFDIGMSPGMAVFIAQNICMELSFNLVGFNYSKYDQSLNGEKSGSLERSGANFKINPFNLNIGLTICI